MVQCTCRHAQIQKVLSEGVHNFDVFFFKLMSGREDPNTNISGPALTRQRNAIYMAFRRRANNGPKLNSGFVALLIFWGSEPVSLK